MIINRIYENQNLLSLYLFSFLFGLRTYQHSCNKFFTLGFKVVLHDKKPAANSPNNRITVLLMSGLSFRFLYAERKDLLLQKE